MTAQYTKHDFAEEDFTDEQVVHYINTWKSADDVSEKKVTASPFGWPDPATIEPRDWLFGRWILRGEVTTIISPGGIGKSGLLVSAAMSMISDHDILGKEVWGGSKNVWYWNLEDDQIELNRQFSASSLFHKISKESCHGTLFADSGLDQRLCTAIEGEKGFEIVEPVYEAVLKQIRERDIDVLIIDPFVSSHEISENDNVKMDKIIKRWKKVAADGGCAIVLAHHSRKANGQETTTEDSRGASAVGDAARVSLALNRMNATESGKLGIKPAERHSIFRVDMGKSSRAPIENASWYKFHSQELGNARSDKPGDNVGAVISWSPPDPFESVTLDHLKAVQKAVADGGYRDSVQAKDWIGCLIGEIIGMDLENSKAQIKSIYKTWLANGKLIVVEGKDQNRKSVKFVAVGEPVL